MILMEAMTDEPPLRLRSVHDLLDERFWVPAYQRGYRWDRQQVEALLDDLDEFQRNSRERGPTTYYCLQPVVVRRRDDGSWELIDGQQRLTTITLILRALRDLAVFLKRQPFRMEYETRDGSAHFLENPNPADADRNIDFHHMNEAYQAIQAWFAKRDGGRQLHILECLTGPDGSAPNVRVIWYELEATAKPVDAFVRLNVGRIPLTSAELIRAVIILAAQKNPLDSRDAHQIPQEWDAIERSLQDDAYWMFLQSGRTAPPARIEFLFDLFVQVHGRTLPAVPEEDPLATFLSFQAILAKERTSIRNIWLRFKRLSQTLEEWFEDRTLFHLVGFLVAVAREERLPDSKTRRSEIRVLVDLLARRNAATGVEFDRHLRHLAWRRLLGGRVSESPPEQFSASRLREQIDERLDGLEYQQREGVRTSLLLLNVAALLEQRASTQRFQFDAYKRTDWDIEHVRSVAENIPQSAADRRRWLEHARDFVESPTALRSGPSVAPPLLARIDTQLAASSPDPQVFGEIFHGVRELSGEADARDNENRISNLVLLDMGTNRSYRNAIFPVKRARVIDLDKRGQFVPPVTRNVFLKYYSPDAAQLMLWRQDDEADYRNAMRETLGGFFAPLAPTEAP
jgi:hypothetical protein